MILQKITMRKAYDEAGMNVSDAELDEIYDQMQEQWEDLWLDNTVMLRRRWRDNNNGQTPDGMDHYKILKVARQLADDEIKQQWLAPLTETIINNQLDDEDDRYPSDEEILMTPGMWKTQWDMMTFHDRDAMELIDELFPNKPRRWTIIAEIYLRSLQMQGKPYPTKPGHPLIPQFEKDVDPVWEETEARRLRLKRT